MMKTIYKKYSLLILTTIICAIGYAHDIEIDGICYNLNHKKQEASVTFKGEVIWAEEYSKKIVIPSSISVENKTYNVTSIEEDAFSSCSHLTSVIIPNSVTNIEKGAFSNCKALISVEIPNSVSIIADNTFSLCESLENIVLPNSVTSIGSWAFHDCQNLRTINIPSSVTNIGDMAFYECTGLIQITVDKNNKVYDSREDCNALIKTATNELIVGCRNTVIPNSISRIKENAFAYTPDLSTINIPNSVSSIGKEAFRHCIDLTSIIIPQSLIQIETETFYGCM